MSNELKQFTGANDRFSAIEIILAEALAWQYFQSGMSVQEAGILIETHAMRAPFEANDQDFPRVAADSLRDHARRLSEAVKSQMAILKSSRQRGA